MPKFSSITKDTFSNEQFIGRHTYFRLLYNCIHRMHYWISKIFILVTICFFISGCVSKKIIPISNHNPSDNNISYPLQVTMPSGSHNELGPNIDNYSFPTFIIIISIVLTFCFFPYLLLFLKYFYYKIKDLTKIKS